MLDDLHKRVLHGVLGVMLVLQNAERRLLHLRVILLVNVREFLLVCFAFQCG